MSAGYDTPDVQAIVLERLDEILARVSAPPRRFYSIAHAATYTDLSEDSIRRLVDKGELVGRRPIRGKLLIDRRELDALVLGRTHRPTNGRGIRRPH